MSHAPFPLLSDLLNSTTSDVNFESIYFDFAEAFDKVNHKLFLKNHYIYDILNGLRFSWVFLLAICSHWWSLVLLGPHHIITISGVPQGTALFLTFIIDALLNYESLLLSFVVVQITQGSYPIKTEHNVVNLQDDLNNVISWSYKKIMTLHQDKLEYMFHGFKRNNSPDSWTSICMRELFHYYYSVPHVTSICPADQLRDLRFLVSRRSNLSWSPHVRSIANKAQKKAAWVLSVFCIRSLDIMLALYKSMVRSILEYWSPSWDPVMVSEIQELEGVQKAFTAKISGMKDIHLTGIFCDNWLSCHYSVVERDTSLSTWLCGKCSMVSLQTTSKLNSCITPGPLIENLAKTIMIRRSASSAYKSIVERSSAVIGPKLQNTTHYRLHLIRRILSISKASLQSSCYLFR